jgi:hypothetical protein
MIALGLNCLLGLLLVCALVMGLRLDRRLRALRDSHADFAKAVQEMDQAALRTEASLAALRAGTEQARTDLASRIDQARLLTQRLDKLSADAGRALEPAPARPAPRPVAQPALLRAVPAAPAPAPVAERPNPRSKVMVDDDLFEIGGGLDRRPPLAAVMGGRR